MKQVLEPIEVQPPHSPEPRYAPERLRWRGQVLAVEQVLESWSWRGRWWLDPHLAGEHRRYYRVLCSGRVAAGRRGPAREVTGKILEIFRRQQDGAQHWILSRIAD